MNAEVQALAARVQELEQTALRWKRIGIATAALAGVATLASMAPALCKTVYGERFVLQDSSGRERAVMTAYETGGLPQFTLMDQNGKQALSFGVADNGRGYIEVPGNEGKAVRSHFAIGAEGNATIEMPSKCKAESSKCTEKKDASSTN